MSSHGRWLMIGLLGYRKSHHSLPLSPPFSSPFPACFTLTIHRDLSVTHFWKNNTKDMSTLRREEGEVERRIWKEEKREQENIRKCRSPKRRLLMIHNCPKSLTHPKPWLAHTLVASVSLPVVPEPLPWLANACLLEMVLTARVCKWGSLRGSEKRVEVKPGLCYHTHQACSPSLTKLLLSHDSFLSSPLCHLCRETWAQCSTCCTTTTPTSKQSARPSSSSHSPPSSPSFVWLALLAFSLFLC